MRNALSSGTSSSGEHGHATVSTHTNPEDHNVVALLIAQGKEVRMDRRNPGITSATTPTHQPSHGNHHTYASTPAVAIAVTNPGDSGYGTSRRNRGSFESPNMLSTSVFLRSGSSGPRGTIM